MPWKETCSLEERSRLIALWNEGERTVAELAREFGVSRKTIYKWAQRYEAEGPAGLAERTTVAAHHPHATPDDVVNALVEIRSCISSVPSANTGCRCASARTMARPLPRWASAA